MRIFAWAMLAIIALIILALIYYLVVGHILFRSAFSRNNHSIKILRKTMDKKFEAYKIDFEWWKGKDFKKITIESHDQLKLVGYLYDNGYPQTALIVHGYGANHKEMQQYCKFFYDRGFNVLAIDNRAHGESEGNLIGFGWLERKDILSWIEFLNKKDENKKIVLFGLSMGSTTVCCASGENLPKNVVACISDCGFASLKGQINHILRKSKVAKFLFVKHMYSYLKRVQGFDVNEANAVKQVKNTNIPILFIHGKEDDFVSVANVQILYDAAPENLKELYIVEGAGHVLSYPTAGKAYERKILSFLRIRTTLDV